VAAKVLHFGRDDCNRLLVLRSVGYSVDVCASVTEFRPLLQKVDTDAVVVTGGPSRERHQIVTLTREHSSARLILFDRSYSAVDEGEFDLVIPPLMDPDEWLLKIADLIERSRSLKATSTVIRERSARLIRDSKAVRLESMLQRNRSVAARAKAKKTIAHIKRSSDQPDQS